MSKWIALLILLVGNCSAQTSLFNVTIGKPVNNNLDNCTSREYPFMTDNEQPCVINHIGEDDTGKIFFFGDVGSVQFGELDGVVQYIGGFYNIAFKDEVARQLRKKFGPPVVTRERWENGLHISFIELTYSWHRRDSEILLTREDSDTCRVLVWTPKWKRNRAKIDQWVDGTPLGSKPLF